MGKLFDVRAIVGGAEDEDLAGACKASSLAVNNSHWGAKAIVDIVRHLQTSDTIHFVTEGAWSLHQLLIAVTELTGPAAMYVSSYAMSEASARTIANLQAEGLITSLDCVIDNRIESRTAGSLQLLQSIANSCVLRKCHAKATVLVGSKASVAIIGSANYTENKRIETGLITTDLAAVEFHKNWILKTISDGHSYD